MPFGAGTDASAAMPANVEKCAQRVTAITSNDDAFTGNLSQKKVARRRDLIYAPGANPGLAVEAFDFVAEEIRICVVAGR
jgi:hypothetical protein